MKLGLLILILSLAQQGLAVTLTELSCKGEDHTFFSIGTGRAAGLGQLMHNYSSGNVICPHSFFEALKIASKIKCYGSWHWDHTRGSTTLESLAWVEITRTGSQITAVTQTNRVYGQRIKNMNCRLTTTERQ